MEGGRRKPSYRTSRLTITDNCIQLSTPVHSKTASNPSSSPSTDCTTSLPLNPSHPVFATSNASNPLTLGPLGNVWMPVAQSISVAKSSLPCSMSTAMTVVQPDARARAHTRRPTAPAPRTRIRAPGVRCARRKAWRTTERGSARAARGRSSVGGSLSGPFSQDPFSLSHGEKVWQEFAVGVCGGGA